MAIDPSIALGFRGIEAPNPLTAYGQVAQIQNAQNQNALAQYQLGAAKRAEEQQNALNAQYAQHFDPTTGQVNIKGLLGGLAASGQGAQIPVQMAKHQELMGKEATLQKTQADIVTAQKKHLDSVAINLSFNPSNENIIAHNQDIQQGNFAPEIKTWASKQEKILLAMKPDERKAYLEKSGATAGDYVSAANNAATVAEQKRAHDMADARARDRLNAEMATGTLTPQSLDVAANVYLQTGQLPTGMGKTAAGLRTQVMNRATELSSGKPAADVANSVVGAKLDVASRGKAIKDFSTGIQGRQVNAFNTAIDHLSTMDKLTDALNNGDIKAVNSIGNLVASQTGQPAPTNFDAAKQIVTSEIIKAVVASGGGVTERQEAERNFASANSPAQLKGVINTYKQLLGGQLKSLNLQYENTTGRKDFGNKLTGEAKNVVKQLSGEQNPATAGGVDTSNPLLK
jgi:hypothetical protein